jgi:hypothetical protein|tara:strand:- start:11414 stop:14485 length:3072 start_codon:yes stop_codon:yes gene_type:complete
MAKFTKKINPLVSRQFPQHIQANNPLLVEFIKQYYVFMDSAQITISSVTASDQILLETTTEGFIALNATNERGNDENDYILNEQTSVGEFQKGETITGATSGQTATILAEDTDNLKIYVTANSLFVTGETITGGTSGATGVIGRYRANPNETINQLLEYANVNNTIDDFFTEFRNTFLQTIPNTLTDGLDKRQLTKNIIDLYKRKGTKKGHEIFFRALFNETPELYYPTVDMLRVSDGNFENEQIIKATLNSPTDGNMNNLVGKTITQLDIVGNDTVDAASSVIESATVSTVSLNGIPHDVATFVLNKVSTTGTFASNAGDAVLIDGTDSSETDAGDEIILNGTDADGTNAGDRLVQNTKSTFAGIDNSDPDVTITCNVESVVDDVDVTSPGQYYTVGETFTFTKEKGGTGAIGQIEEVTYGVIDSVQVESGGSGYAVGDVLSVTNPTDGTGLAGKVAIVNGGFTLEGDVHDDGVIILEDGTDFQLVMEAATNSSTNDITKIRLTNKGGGYLSLPTVTVTSSTGSSVTLYPVSSSIGNALSVKMVDHGFRYETPPEVSPKLHLQIDTVSAGFSDGETITAENEDFIELEPFEQVEFTILLEDFRQSVLRLDNEHGDIILEDELGGGQIAVEEFVTEAVPESKAPDSLLLDGTNGSSADAGDRVRFDEYILKDNTDYIILNGTNGDSANAGGKIQRDDTVTVSATFESFNTSTNILTLTQPTGNYDDKVTIAGGTSGTTARVRNFNTETPQATMIATVGTAIDTDGGYTGVDGFVSESTKKIQDSLYYQDYSYIIKVGESITEWRDYLKSAVHPAGFYFAGEVSIRTRLNAKMKTGYTRLSGLTETDEVIEILSVIFGEKIGRRLGTEDDGSSLRDNPHLGVELGASLSGRALTLKDEVKIKLNQQRDSGQTIQSTSVTTGFVYAGARLNTIGDMPFTAFGNAVEGGGGMSGITLATLHALKLTGTQNDTIDQATIQIADFASSMGTRFAIPTEISFEEDSFSSAGPAAISFDNQVKKFDDNTR